MSTHTKAVLQALFVTFLWSTSWVLIKIGLADDIPALTFAGLRYTLAFLCLLPLAWRGGHLAELRGVSRPGWGLLIILGIIYYTITQGTQFIALETVPSVTVSLLLNFSAIVVAFLGIVFLREKLSLMQWVGVVVALVGALVYFFPVVIPAGQTAGLIAAIVSMLATSTAAVLGRYVNRDGSLHPLAVTTATMGIGAILLLIIGLLVQPWPTLSGQNWLIIIWLAIVNTAFAFTLWNHTLRTLTATESSVINNTMLIQIAVLAWVFLGEAISGRGILGLAIVVVGTLIVQLRPTARKR